MSTDSATPRQAASRNLPSLPLVIARLVELDSSSASYADDVQQLVSADPGFAVHILASANSAASAPASPICSIGAAIGRVGSNRAVRALISSGIARVFVPDDPWERGLWRHSIEVAIASREIVVRSGRTGVDAEEAYLCGLLHDIGRFSMFQQSPDLLRSVDESLWRTVDELLAAEVESFGVAHTTLGAQSCREWGLPSKIVDLVRHHHDPCSLGQSPTGRLAAVVHLADLAMLPSARSEPNDLASGGLGTIERQLMPCLTDWIRLDAGDLREIVSETLVRADSIATPLGV